jgi:hypothetical protein
MAPALDSAVAIPIAAVTALRASVFFSHASASRCQSINGGCASTARTGTSNIQNAGGDKKREILKKDRKRQKKKRLPASF